MNYAIGSTANWGLVLGIDHCNQELTFAAVLRSMFRQTPGMVMPGEIRDMETAINASLTGHLFFFTLHTNTTSTVPVSSTSAFHDSWWLQTGPGDGRFPVLGAYW